MSKFQRIIEIDNEVEFITIKELLESNGVKVTSEQKAASSFPVLDGGVKRYHLHISDEDSATFFRLVSKDYRNVVEDVGSVDKYPKLKRRLYFSIVFGFIMTLAFLKYWDINRRSVGTTICYEWSTLNMHLHAIHRASGEKLATYYDTNFDGNYEQTDAFVDGKLVMQSFDTNENGLNNEVKTFDLEGNSTGYNIDRDEDGLFDEVVFILESGERLEFSDIDKDGRYELVQ